VSVRTVRNMVSADRLRLGGHIVRLKLSEIDAAKMADA
jgi:hypothetical protein